MGLRVQNALVSYVVYIRKTLWPHDLSVFVPYPASIPLWQSVAAGFFLIVITMLAVRNAESETLCPGGMVVVHGNSPARDRSGAAGLMACSGRSLHVYPSSGSVHPHRVEPRGSSDFKPAFESGSKAGRSCALSGHDGRHLGSSHSAGETVSPCSTMPWK